METKIETGVVKENNELNGEALEQAYQTHIHKAHMFLALPLRLLILLAGTVLISALYKGMIASGIFKLITDTMQHRLVYCIFELLLLGGFWHGVFMFSKKCRHRSYSLGGYYLMACIIAAVYAGICCVLFHFLNREAYSWLLRITLNLCGLRFRTSFPDHLRPYLVAYLVITTLIMLLEPIIAKWQYRRFIRMQEKNRLFEEQGSGAP